jgi:hypothetical protein
VDRWEGKLRANFFVKCPDDSEQNLGKGERTADPQAMRGERTGRRALTPAQGLERGRDGGEVKVMTVTRAGPIVE